MKSIRIQRVLLLLFLISALFLKFEAASIYAADEENCLMCHKHRFMGRIGENGKINNYNVDESLFSSSIHRNIACRDCHTYIKKLPHDPVTQEINCSNQCHMKPPFNQDKFSHNDIMETYNDSIHGQRAEDSYKSNEAKPYCKFCHLNPMYEKISEERVAYEESLERCFNCHQEKGVVMAYNHITHRLRKKTSRSHRDVIILCGKCHHDEKLMKSLDVSEKALTAVDSYNRSIHGKLVRLGSEKAADCVSCHATNALHDIYKKDNIKSTINKNNIKETCHQCHENTNEWFVKFAVHPSIEHDENPIIHMMSMGLNFSMYAVVFGLVALMAFETYGRKRSGINFLFRNGSSWRKKRAKRPDNE